ncbi:hypothetical protein, partial [Xylella fastidiosa]|uniref:hypothetical protein n=1 Tax=Xylella fastidiosa TaxID=2371 RepID=UPI001EECB227
TEPRRIGRKLAAFSNARRQLFHKPSILRQVSQATVRVTSSFWDDCPARSPRRRHPFPQAA